MSCCLFCCCDGGGGSDCFCCSVVVVIVIVEYEHAQQPTDRRKMSLCIITDVFMQLQSFTFFHVQ